MISVHIKDFPDFTESFDCENSSRVKSGRNNLMLEKILILNVAEQGCVLLHLFKLVPD